MKHPLSSKERRGLAAVAAAALLCVFAGFVFRGCQSGAGRLGNRPSIEVVDDDTVAKAAASKKGDGRRDSISSKSAGKNGKRARRAARKETVYPTREPLDEACD